MEHPKSTGAMFDNKSKYDQQGRVLNEKLPDFQGQIEITREQIAKLVEMGKAGLKVQLQLGSWKRISQNGVSYLYVSAEAYVPKPKQEPQPQGGGWGQQAPQQKPKQQDDGWGNVPADEPAPDFDDQDIPF